MARPLRLHVPNGIYHVTSRGNELRPIYRDDGDRAAFLRILARTMERFAWRCLGYCLMTNHYHLLVRTIEPTLARGMRDLNGVYAQWFNRRHDRVGHLFQGRYRAILVESDAHLLTAMAYIVRNPVRAGMCRRAGDWRWSSHGAVLGHLPPGVLAVDEVLLAFDPRPDVAREQYRTLTEEGEPDRGVRYDEGVIDGRETFARLHLEGIERSPEIPSAHVRPRRRALPEIFARARGIDEIAAAYGEGHTMPAIAAHLGLHPSTISRRLSRYRSAQIKT